MRADQVSDHTTGEDRHDEHDDASDGLSVPFGLGLEEVAHCDSFRLVPITQLVITANSNYLLPFWQRKKKGLVRS